MKTQNFESKIQSIARAAFLCSFALLSAVACGEGFKPHDYDSESVIDGTTAAQLSAVTTTEPSQTYVYGNEGGIQQQTYMMTFVIRDGNRRVKAVTSVDIANSSPRAGTYSKEVDGTEYTLAVNCTDNTCKTFATILNVRDVRSGEWYQESVLFRMNGDRVEEEKRSRGTTYNDVQAALYAMARY